MIVNYINKSRRNLKKRQLLHDHNNERDIKRHEVII